jgi:hypothetical protein
MKQMLLRVPDELHARLTAAARERGTSVNALANDILDDTVPRPALDERTRLRDKARRLGILVERPSTRRMSAEAREAALASTQGIGPVLDKILEDGR